MEKWEMVLVAVLLLSAEYFPRASSSPYYGYDKLFIDCGASNQTETTDSENLVTAWKTDQKFAKTGQNKLLSHPNTSVQMNSLRFFNDGRKNCYQLPLDSADHRFLFRAGFYYGNYDGLSRPPTFDLEIDGILWATVTTALSDEPIFHELVYKTKEQTVSVCLIRTRDGDVPFISSLEVHYVMPGFYRLMENNTALYLHSRINYGANESVQRTIGHFEECCNRIWKSKQMENYLNIASDTIPPYSLLAENSPPWPVMAYAIQAQNLSDPIYITVDFSPQTAVEAYFVLYFMDPVFRCPRNQTSKVEIYIDNQLMDVTDVPEFGRYEDKYHVVSLYPVPVNGSANVTIAPLEGSTLAPILNAMEVFSTIAVSKGGPLFSFSAQFVIAQFLFCLAFLLYFR